MYVSFKKKKNPCKELLEWQTGVERVTDKVIQADRKTGQIYVFEKHESTLSSLLEDKFRQRSPSVVDRR